MNLSQLLTPPEGFGKALQTFSPLALAMAQGIRSGQGAQAYMPQGIAAMMANKDRADLDAKNEKLTGMLDTFGLTPAERALLDTMDLGGKQSYLANLIASRRTGGGGGGRAPTQAEMAAEFLGGLGGMVPAAPSAMAAGNPYSLGMDRGDVMPPSQPLSFGKTVPPAAIEQSTLPPAANDSWVFPSTFSGADPMAGSVVAQTPALASRPVPPPLSPQEAPPVPLSFGARAQMPTQAPQNPAQARLAQLDARIMQVMELAQTGDPRALAALDVLGEQRKMLVGMLPDAGADPTDDIREYQFAVSQGYAGTFQDFMTDMRRAGASSVSVDVGGAAPQVGTIPQGYELFQTPEGGWQMRAIPGGPEDPAPTDEAKRNAALTASSVLTSAATRARDAAANRNAGASGTTLMARLPWTDSAEVVRQTAVLKSNATVSNLNAMRQQSPTGGALGNVTEREGAMLADMSGALDPNSPNFERDLKDYTRTLLRIVHGPEMGDAIFAQTFPEDPNGVPTFNPQTGRWE